MNEKIDIGKTLMKLHENNYDLTELTSIEREYLQKHSPEFIKAVSNIGGVGSKAQEKVYDIIDKAMEIYAEQLKNPNLSEEARDKLNDRIERMVEKAFQKDSEFKRWMFALVWGGTLTLAGSPKMRKAALKLFTKGK